MKVFFYLFILLILFTGCVKPSASAPREENSPDTSTSGTHGDVLIYGGPGSWRAEIESLKKILLAHDVSYRVLAAAELDRLVQEDFQQFSAIVFAGGDAPTVRNSLQLKTRVNIRNAVQFYGLSYLGFCAGAWMAVAPEPLNGEVDVSYGLGIVYGPILQLTFLAKQGLPHALDNAFFPNGSRRKLLWYGGPITLDLPGTVVAKYSDGTPAISQVYSGKGLVVISGLHPAATKSILLNVGLFESEAIAPEFAWALLDAVINRKRLTVF